MNLALQTFSRKKQSGAAVRMRPGTPVHVERLVVIALACLLFAAGCNVGPKYARPPVDMPPAYKEITPADYAGTNGWKVAQPQDSTLHGQWWEMFKDPELNKLEEEANTSNQTIAEAVSNLTEARAVVKQARAQYFPTGTVAPSITENRTSGNLVNGNTGTGSSHTLADYTLPFDASWVPDLWGRVRNTVAANTAAAQVSAADLENTRLTVNAEVAVDYFNLRGQDALKELLDSTVVAYQQSLDLTKALYDTGIDSDEAVAQAETQLETTQAEDTNLGILRAQYEHALATLTGKTASTFSVPVLTISTQPPGIPLGVPSQLLERRPDIAAAERTMAEANAQIGIARAAYYPTLTLSGSAGFESNSITDWISWPSRIWAVGSTLSETVFDAGLRRATVEQYRAAYDSSVANYRETVLTAFQQVEDNLASLRILSQEVQQQDAAVRSAQRNLDLATQRYKLGIDPYLNVITAQTTLLTNKQTAVNLRIQQMTASVQLIEALGGGWDASQLPTARQLIAQSPQSGAAGVTQASPAASPAKHD
ncbi:MAG TPA: efflux transporter outer membrane subunit [Candidatus Acidoferrum sp.]|nr:efflux transporter outer membrane subunit [Candidatus Acidoferrum sp.]